MKNIIIALVIGLGIIITAVLMRPEPISVPTEIVPVCDLSDYNASPLCV